MVMVMVGCGGDADRHVITGDGDIRGDGDAVGVGVSGTHARLS